MGQRTLVRRLLVSFALVGLLGSASFLQIQNAQLAKAIEAHQNIKPSPPKVDPVPDPSPTIAYIEAIRTKLLADGCNLSLDISTLKKPLGTCKVLLIGDSLGNNLGYGMIPQLQSKANLTFTLKAKASTGLSNAWFYNWHNNLATYLKTYKPNLVIVFLGANDRQNYVVNNSVQNFGSEAWKETYRSNITKLATAATKSGAYVLWVGMPIMKPFNYAKGITLIDEQFAMAVPKVPGATYMPLREFTADSEGNYRASAPMNGKLVQIRGEDGIHFSSMGQSVIGTYTINSMNKLFHVVLSPSNPRYITK